MLPFFTQIMDFFKRIFNKKSQTTPETAAENSRYVAKYENITDVNLTVIVSNKIANIVVSDSSIQVEGNNARAEYLNSSLQNCVARLKLISSRILGTGGVVLVPRIYKNKIYTDIVVQSNFCILEQQGDMITSAGFIAEEKTVDRTVYLRIEYHTLRDDGSYVIEQRAMSNGNEVPLLSVPEWSMYQAMSPMTFTNVDRMLFSFIKCPTDNRKQTSNNYGVPVTYGSEKLISEIVTLLNMMQKEYINKEAFIGADSLLFAKDPKTNKEILPDSGIYKLFRTVGNVDDKPFFEVFSPDIRTQSYIDGINYRMGLLEKAVGVNKGVLTDLDTADATATAIRRSSFDTFSLVDSMRSNIEVGVEQLVYAYNVLADAFNLAPSGKYEIKYDWDYSLLEDSAEAYDQRERAVAAGAAGPEELRMYLYNEDRETAIANLPDTEQLLRSG